MYVEGAMLNSVFKSFQSNYSECNTAVLLKHYVPVIRGMDTLSREIILASKYLLLFS